MHFFVYRTLNTNKVKYKNFLHKVGRSWISEGRIEVRQVLMIFICQRREPKQDPPGRPSGDFRIHKLHKNCWWWGGKKEVS